MKETIRRLVIHLALVAAIVPAAGAQPAGDYFTPVPESFYEDLAFDMPRVPVPSIPDIVTEPIRFNLYYGGEAPSPDQKTVVVDRKKLAESLPPVTVETPQFRDIHLKNIQCRGAQTAMWIQGLPEMPVRNITIENARISADRGGLVTDIEGLTLIDVDITVHEGPILYMNNGRDVLLEKVSLAYEPGAEGGTALKVVGPFTERIRLMDVETENVRELLERGPNVEDGDIIRQE